MDSATHRSHRESDHRTTGRVALAEDDRSLRDVLVSVLEDEGYEVAQLEDGPQLEAFLTAPPQESLGIDLVISDVRMPGLTGLQVLERFRQIDARTPFILITAFGSPELHNEARRLGATAHLDKPFDLDDLMMMVRLLVLTDSLPQPRRMARLLEEKYRSF